jgi:hypothetical protein
MSARAVFSLTARARQGGSRPARARPQKAAIATTASCAQMSKWRSWIHDHPRRAAPSPLCGPTLASSSAFTAALPLRMCAMNSWGSF